MSMLCQCLIIQLWRIEKQIQVISHKSCIYLWEHTLTSQSFFWYDQIHLTSVQLEAGMSKRQKRWLTVRNGSPLIMISLFIHWTTFWCTQSKRLIGRDKEVVSNVMVCRWAFHQYRYIDYLFIDGLQKNFWCLYKAQIYKTRQEKNILI